MRLFESMVVFLLVGGGALAACGNSQDVAGGSDAGVDSAIGMDDGGGLPACSTDLSTDVRHCGSCSTDCTHLPNVNGNTVSCEQGACVTARACLDGFADCDPNAAGCETKLGSIGACTACGQSCSGSTPVCGADGCAASCRGTAPDECSGTCTDTQIDSQNCGACGTVCKGDGGVTQGICVAGVCQSECQPGYNACGGTCVSSMTRPRAGRAARSAPVPRSRRPPAPTGGAGSRAARERTRAVARAFPTIHRWPAGPPARRARSVTPRPPPATARAAGCRAMRGTPPARAWAARAAPT